MKTMESYIKPETSIIEIELESVMAQSKDFIISEEEHIGGMSRSQKKFWGEE